MSKQIAIHLFKKIKRFSNIQEASDYDAKTFPLHNILNQRYCPPLKEFKELVEQNLENINQCDSLGNTPLHIAASKGWSRIISFLIEKGADLEAVNKSGEKPINVATNKYPQAKVILKEALEKKNRMQNSSTATTNSSQTKPKASAHSIIDFTDTEKKRSRFKDQSDDEMDVADYEEGELIIDEEEDEDGLGDIDYS